jgi:Fe-S cluster biogenesis protein NfuA/nitrite reductase/ring-hydroxylating ferredoxin subunit
MLVDDRELTERAARIDALLAEIQSLPDPALRDRATEVVESLLLLYGEGLARMMDRIFEEGGETASDAIFNAFARDELISHLLCLHDLHPVPVEARVARALEEVRPYLESHGGNVELLGVEEGVARLRLQGSCSGCPSSTMTLKLAIEEAIAKAAPDIDRIEAEGVAEPPPRPVSFLPASDIILLKERRQPASGPAWTSAGSVDALDGLDLKDLVVAGVSLLFVRSGGTLYAYRNVCPRCGSRLEGGLLQGDALTCPTCGRSYDVRRAGRALDSPDGHLEPVPLLLRGGEVRVALGDT